MILLLSKNSRNNPHDLNAVHSFRHHDPSQEWQYYQDVNLENMKEGDDTLFIVKLTGGMFLKNLLEADTLSKELIEKGMPTSVKKICLLLPDTDSKNPVEQLGSQLSQELASKGYNISVSVLTDCNYAMTFAVPPEKCDENWKICHVECSHLKELENKLRTEASSKNPHFNVLVNFNKVIKKPVADIQAWMNQSAKTFNYQSDQENWERIFTP